MELIRKVLFVAMLSAWGYYAFSISDLQPVKSQEPLSDLSEGLDYQEA